MFPLTMARACAEAKNPIAVNLPFTKGGQSLYLPLVTSKSHKSKETLEGVIT